MHQSLFCLSVLVQDSREKKNQAVTKGLTVLPGRQPQIQSTVASYFKPSVACEKKVNLPPLVIGALPMLRFQHDLFCKHQRYLLQTHPKFQTNSREMVSIFSWCLVRQVYRDQAHFYLIEGLAAFFVVATAYPSSSIPSVHFPRCSGCLVGSGSVIN